MRMGFRNHIVRTVILLALALGVGVAVALLSGGERTRAVQGSSLPVIEQHADQHLVRPLIRLAPGLSCGLHEGCARL